MGFSHLVLPCFGIVGGDRGGDGVLAGMAVGDELVAYVFGGPELVGHFSGAFVGVPCDVSLAGGFHEASEGKCEVRVRSAAEGPHADDGEGGFVEGYVAGVGSVGEG